MARVAQEVNVSAINFLVFYFKIFRYIGKAPRMGIIFQTLQTAAFDLVRSLLLPHPRVSEAPVERTPARSR